MKITKLAIPAMLLLLLAATGCQKNEATLDIRGTWEFHNEAEVQYVFTFSGSPASGTLSLADPQAGAGTYAVSGNDVVFDFTSTWIGGRSCRFSGSFVAADKLEGTMDFAGDDPPFHWSATVEGRKQ